MDLDLSQKVYFSWTIFFIVPEINISRHAYALTLADQPKQIL